VVGVESISAGNPVVTVIFPKKNECGIDFAQIKRALRDDSVILHFSSADERESFKFVLKKSDVASHSVRPKKRPVAPIIKV
jgi:phosphopantetheinyl transferase